VDLEIKEFAVILNGEELEDLEWELRDLLERHTKNDDKGFPQTKRLVSLATWKTEIEEN